MRLKDTKKEKQVERGKTKLIEPSSKELCQAIEDKVTVNSCIIHCLIYVQFLIDLWMDRENAFQM